MSLTDLLVPTYRQMLGSLAGRLDKALQQGADGAAEGILAARLAPDMLPLAAQVRFAAFQAQESVHRRTGQALPDRLGQSAAEGWAVPERPGTVTEAKARITEALACLDDLEPAALDGGATRPIALDLPHGLAFDLTGELYARDWALPPFSSHVVTAYAILRNHGIVIGKAEYVPHLFAYLRAGAPARVQATSTRPPNPAAQPGRLILRRPLSARTRDEDAGGRTGGGVQAAGRLASRLFASRRNR